MQPRARIYNAWVFVRPADDVAGQWVAHCLEFDVVTQGNSLAHALEMVVEAVSMVVADDLDAGRDPLARRAPPPCWDEMWTFIRGRTPRMLSEADLEHGTIAALAGQFEFTVVEHNAPLAWRAPIVFEGPAPHPSVC